MSKLTYDEAQQKMIAVTAKMTTDVLCTTLLLLEGRELDNAERMVQGHIADELCERIPEACAAADRWVEDPAMWDLSLTEVIVAAAQDAA
jgi:hypothetical protein